MSTFDINHATRQLITLWAAFRENGGDVRELSAETLLAIQYSELYVQEFVDLDESAYDMIQAGLAEMHELQEDTNTIE